MKAKHASTPWESITEPYKGWSYEGGFLGTIVDAKGKQVYAGPASFHALKGVKQNHKANAEHIVKCVNSHDELLEALNNAINEINNELGEWQAVTILYCPVKLRSLKKLVGKLEQAIAKAEE